MKKVIELKKESDAIKEHLKVLYGLDYLDFTDDSINASKGGVKVFVCKWSAGIDIEHSCPTTQPETIEEFNAVKKERSDNEAHLRRIVKIWQKAKKDMK